MDELQQLKQEVQKLQKKVDDLYSITGFPDSIIENLKRRGFVKIDETLLKTFYTQDARFAKTYSMFSKIGNLDVVFDVVDKQEIKTIQNVNSSTDTFTINNHGYNNGDIFTFWSTTTPPDPLINGGTYYTRDVTTNTFKLTDTVGGSAINITDTGLGTHYMARINILF
jgi:hypothetical protein